MDPRTEDFRLKAKVLSDKTTQVSYIPDQAGGVQRITEIWTKQRVIGTGASGEVFLERTDSGKELAVKEVKRYRNLSDYTKELEATVELSKVDLSDYTKELEAMVELSKVITLLHLTQVSLSQLTNCYALE